MKTLKIELMNKKKQQEENSGKQNDKNDITKHEWMTNQEKKMKLRQKGNESSSLSAQNLVCTQSLKRLHQITHNKFFKYHFLFGENEVYIKDRL